MKEQVLHGGWLPKTNLHLFLPQLAEGNSPWLNGYGAGLQNHSKQVQIPVVL